jgi:DNA polymerase I
MEKKLYLLDAYSLIFRAYYAFINNPRFTSKGLNTSAIFGFVMALDDILKKEKPTHIAVAFDVAAPTFRHKIFEAYKSQRPPTPEAIKQAVPYIYKILNAYNIPIIEAEGFEADDVIGTIATRASSEGFKVYMVTPDKDYCQLVNENCFVYKPKKSGNDVEIWGVKEVCQNFDIDHPSKVIDILALWGDAADNIPGAPGIGEVTSKKLIKEWGTVEGLIANADKLKGKAKEAVTTHKDQLLLSKYLVTINLEVPVEFNEENYRLKDLNKAEMTALFEELEFRNLMQRVVPKPAPPAQPTLFDLSPAQHTSPSDHEVPVHSYKTIKDSEHQYFAVETNEQLEHLITQLSALNEFCFDTETTGLDVHQAELVGMSFCWKAGEAFYVPVSSNQTEAKLLINKFKSVFENSSIRKIGQNCKFDILMLSRYGIEVKGELFDTMIAHYLLEPDQPHNMDHLSKVYLGYEPVPIEELIGKNGREQKTMRSVALGKITEYAAEDADVTWQLKETLEKKLAEHNLLKLAQEMEMPLIYVLADMENTGVKLDSEVLSDYAKVLTEKAILVENEIKALAGFDFNISSTKQLGEVLFERLKIVDDPKMTKTKQYATGEEELLKLLDKHPIVQKILDFRGLKKLLSTYVEALPKMVNPQTGKVHTSYNQAVASTGRLSSNNPNLQNIPIRTEEGRYVRKAFIASGDDFILIDADYSQIELRLMAHLSGDENMIQAFRDGEDIHAATASKIFKVPLAEVTKEMRSQAKSANFGIIYGISSFGLAQNLNISRSEAKQLIDGYFASYPKVKEFMDQSIKQAREKGYVETLLNRRRQLPEINSNNQMVRGFAERNAINAPIQGTAADIIKIAMIRIQNRFKQEKLVSKMILQVHDELIFDVFQPEKEIIKEIIRSEMENAIQLSVPLTVDMGEGRDWLVAH